MLLVEAEPMGEPSFVCHGYGAPILALAAGPDARFNARGRQPDWVTRQIGNSELDATAFYARSARSPDVRLSAFSVADLNAVSRKLDRIVGGDRVGTRAQRSSGP